MIRDSMGLLLYLYFVCFFLRKYIKYRSHSKTLFRQGRRYRFNGGCREVGDCTKFKSHQVCITHSWKTITFRIIFIRKFKVILNYHDYDYTPSLSTSPPLCLSSSLSLKKKEEEKISVLLSNHVHMLSSYPYHIVWFSTTINEISILKQTTHVSYYIYLKIYTLYGYVWK